MASLDCPFRLEAESITKSDLERVVERLNQAYEEDFMLQAHGSPTVYAIAAMDGSKVFKSGDNREVYYLGNGMLQARRFD